MRNSKWLLPTLTAVYITFIVWACLEPFSTFSFFIQYFTDLEFHTFSFSLLSFLVCLCMHSFLKFRFTRKRQAGGILTAALLSFGFGGFTEAIQGFTIYRTPNWTDFQCDLMGAVLGITLFILTLNIQRTIKVRRRALGLA